MSKKNIMSVALEDEEIAVPEVAEAVATVPETEAEVETASTEIEEQAGQVAEVNEVIEDTHEAADTLSDIKETMQDSVDSGEGMSETSAEIAEIAIESIFASIGFKPVKKPLPGLESFGSKHSRKSATEIAIESLGENIKKIWDGIMKAMVAMWEKVTTFIGTLFRHLPSLIKHLKALEAKLKSIPNVSPEGELTSAAVAAFSIDGETDAETIGLILQDTAHLVQISLDASEATVHLAEGTISANTLKDMQMSSTEFGKKIRDAMKTLDGVGGTNLGTFLNSGTISFAIDEKTESGKQSIGTFTFSKIEGKVAEKCKPLTKSEMQNTLTAAINMAEKMSTFDKSKSRFESAIRILKGFKYNERGQNGETGKVANQCLQLARELNSFISKMSSMIPSLIFKTAKTAGDIVKESMKCYKASEEPASNSSNTAMVPA